MRFLFVLLMLLAIVPARASEDVTLPKVEFAATAVHESGAYRETERIHYAAGKLRIDRPNGFSSTILDLTSETQCLLMANHTYLVLPMDDALFRRFFARIPKLADDRKITEQRIEGMETTKYEFGDEGALNAAGYYWLTDNGIMLRREYEDGVYGRNLHHVEYLSDVEIGNQAPELFAIPPGYKRAR